MLVDVSQFKISDWRNRNTTNLVLRIFTNTTFVANDGEDGDLIEANVHYGQVPVTVSTESIDGYSSPTLTIPALKIHSTTDAIVNRNATYRAEIWSTRLNRRLETLTLLTAFKVTFTEFETNWTAIIQFNTPLPLSVQMTLDEEIKALINSQFAALNFNIGSGTPQRIGRFKPSGIGLQDSDYEATSTELRPIVTGKNLGTISLPFLNGYFENTNAGIGNITSLLSQTYGISNGTKSLFSNIDGDDNAQYARVSASTLGVAQQTIDRRSLNQLGVGLGLSSNLAFYGIPFQHSSGYEGEKYTFKTAGDSTGVTGSHLIQCTSSEGSIICALTVAPGVSFRWNAEISVTMADLTIPEVVIQASIHTSNGQSTTGILKTASIATLDEFIFYLAATDSLAAETRALFAETIHEDWSKN